MGEDGAAVPSSNALGGSRRRDRAVRRPPSVSTTIPCARRTAAFAEAAETLAPRRMSRIISKK
jgi:hypothetical protein